MGYHATIGATRHRFGSLREVMGKATPHRSGDLLAGVAAESAQQRMAV